MRHLHANSQRLLRTAGDIDGHMQLLCLSILVHRDEDAAVSGLSEVQGFCTAGSHSRSTQGMGSFASASENAGNVCILTI